MGSDPGISTPAGPARNRRISLVRRPAGVPCPGDFAIGDAPVPAIEEGQLLVRNLFLSVDPAQRGWASATANYSNPVPIGTVMRSLAVGQIVQSRAAGISPGAFVYGWLGWQEWAIVGPGAILTWIGEPRAPLPAYAGPLGINGVTALLALEGCGRPVPGETILVSTAAGAVGSIVGQLARQKGCRAIGLAGSAAKAARCTERFGYDQALDYHVADLAAALRLLAPEGIDIYFDNVGGATLDAVLRLMRPGGRVIQCGTASVSLWDPPPTGLRPEREVLMRRLSWNGFVVFDHVARFPGAIDRLAAMIGDGSLVYDEDIESGIEAAPAALAALYAGLNTGKKLIKVAEL